MTARKRPAKRRGVTSYQHQKQRATYHMVRGARLEGYVHTLYKQLCEAGISPVPPTSGGDTLTDASGDDLAMTLAARYQPKQRRPGTVIELAEPDRPWWKFW